jgi:hypothetical protein
LSSELVEKGFNAFLGIGSLVLVSDWLI